MFQDAVKSGWLFYEKAGKECGSKQNVNTDIGRTEKCCAKKSVAGTHPAYHPANNVKVDQNIHGCKK